MAKEKVKKKKPPAKKNVAQSKKAKPPSGTLTERIGEVKNRPNKGLPAQVKKSRGNFNRANPPKEIRMGGQGGTSRSIAQQNKFKPLPLGESSKRLTGAKVPGGRGIRLTSLAGGPVGIAAQVLLTSATPAGEDSGTSKYWESGKFGPIRRTFKDFKGQANPKVANPYTPSRKKKDIVGRNPNEGLGRPSVRKKIKGKRVYTSKVGPFKPEPTMPSVSMAGGGVNQPEAKASTFREKNLKANQEIGKAKPFVSVVTPKAPKAKAPAFKGNWVGAAPTEMQKRGGRKIKRPNLLSLLRGKK